MYDALNRMTQKSYPDSTSVEYVYDLVGKVQQVNDPTGTYGFAYDNMGRLIGTTTQYAFLTGQTFTNSYAYDAASNRTGFTAPDGSTNAYSYDSLNRLNNLTNSLTGSFGFSYDQLSRRTQLTRPNGVNTNYAYDNLSQLLSVLHQSGSTTLDGASYTYDNAGNRVSKTNYLNNITEDHAYDPLYQLTQVTQGASTSESYSYDSVGNRLSSLGMPSYSYNAANELTSTTSGSYSYDANGNMLTDSSGKAYTWDFQNHLTQVTVPQTGGGSSFVTFKYDPFGRRVQKSSASSTTNYLYDGSNPLQELDGAGNVLARYTQTMIVDEPLSLLRASATSYYHQDGLGSITSLSTSAGAFANTYTYDSFGNLTASTGSVTNPLRYTGREFDQETGMLYYRARHYDQNIGRFISEDPFRSSLKMNRYSYVSNRPVSLIDPSGKQEQCRLLSTFTIPWVDEWTHPGKPRWKFIGVAQAEEPSDDPNGMVPSAPVTSLSCLWEKTIRTEIWGRQFKRFHWECEYTLMCGEKIHYDRIRWETQTWWKAGTSTTERVGSGPFPVAPIEFQYEDDCERFGPPE